ncbi:MAG: hypothetical protein COS89_03480, partial [Deltaproteobacteria bacterium CG07_land_8_20_14_0_80_38_7]
VLKWFILATIIGSIVGLATVLFLKALNWSSLQTSAYNYYYLLLPVAFFISALTIKYIAPDAEGHGTEKVIEAVHKRAGRIKPAVVPVKLFTTVITIASGGSAGKEGPCAQIGAGLSSIFSDILRMGDVDRKKLVICGISAGFAAVFGTPIAGAMFGIEVLFVGGLVYDVLLPSFIAGITAYHVSTSLGITYFYHPMHFVPVFSELFFIKVAVAGVFFGICSFLLIESLKIFKQLSEKIKVWTPLKGIIGGCSLILLTLIFSKDFLGLGLDKIEYTLQGVSPPWYSFIMKIIFTSITLTFGGSGGIVTPIFFIGVTSGSLFANIFHLDVGTFAAIGMVSLLAGATNTPIAASIMAVELFGPRIAPYAAVSCVICFLMTGHRSVYPSQVFAISKSPSLAIDIGKEEEDIMTRVTLRDKGFIRFALNIVLKIKKILFSQGDKLE